MIAFIVPLKSKAGAKDWPMVSKLCLRTLRSLLQQTDSSFKILLVCNEPPEGLVSSEKLLVVRRDFPIPENRMARYGYDKLCKVCHGLVAAADFNPSHYMLVDADDLVSRNLVEHVRKHPPETGWFAKTGWIYFENREWLLYQSRNFHRMCGTAVIAPFDRKYLPKNIEEDFNPYRPYLEHNRSADSYRAAGINMQPFPFPAVIYCTGAWQNWGENLAAKKLKFFIKRLIWTRSLTRQRQLEYGLNPL